MSVVDLLVSQTDPLTAIILFGILAYLRLMRRDVQQEFRQIRKRTQRLENYLLRDDNQ